MIDDNPFSIEGQWFRGNTHSHTTASDGSLTVTELAGWYEEYGYDFLFVTDHDLVADLSDRAQTTILLIPGAEIVMCWDEVYVAEMLSLGIDEVKRAAVHPQQIIDDVLELGGLPFVSHPHLSGVSSGSLMKLEGIAGIEVFNGGAVGSGGRHLATIHWDDLLSNGRMVWGLASDDRHSGLGSPEEAGDRAKGWVMVKAEECTRESIIDAMRNGLFYSTSGPVIHDIKISDVEVTVHCSAARAVTFVSLPWMGRRVSAEPGDLITEASLPLDRLATPAKVAETSEQWLEKGYFTKPKEMPTFFRVEIEDETGRTAWSNPIDL